MEWLYYLSALFLVLLVLLNLGATIAIVRSDALEQFQKIAQGILVWIVPLIGSLFVLHLLKESEPEVIPRRLVACSGIGWCFLWAYLRQAEDKDYSGHEPLVGKNEADTSGGAGGSEQQ